MTAITDLTEKSAVVAADDFVVLHDTTAGVDYKVPISKLIGGWRDLRMSVSSAATGGGSPALAVFGPTGNIKQTAFAVGDSVYLEGHIDHDMKVGSTMYQHVHWSTNGTDTNIVKWQLSYISAPGHDQGNYGADTVTTVEEAAAGTAWRGMVTEHGVGFTAPEVDSLVIMELKRITNGATDNADVVFANFVDLHYEAAGYGTVSRLPDFYT